MNKNLVSLVTCLRCGFINQFVTGLTSVKDTATYRCDNCKFIALQTWTEEID